MKRMFRPVRLTAVLAVLASLAAYGQGNLAETLAKAPPEIDEALRARLQQFIGLLSQEKFRQAESLVAEDSKDRYYNMDKNRIDDFRLIKIAYEDDYTKAVVIGLRTADLPATAPGAASTSGQMARIPVTMRMHWKIENGLWCWYLPPEKEFLDTPWGKMRNPNYPGNKNKRGKADLAAAQKQAEAQVNAFLANTRAGVKVDKQSLDFSCEAPSEHQVEITNILPGSVKLKLEVGEVKGLAFRLDKTDLGPNESTRLTARYSAPEKLTKSNLVNLVVRVEPTGQGIPITIHLNPPKS